MNLILVCTYGSPLNFVSKIKRIVGNRLLFLLKPCGNHTFYNYFRGIITVWKPYVLWLLRRYYTLINSLKFAWHQMWNLATIPLFFSTIYLIRKVEEKCKVVVIGFSRINHSQLFLKIGVLKKFAIFTGKNLSWSLFLIKLQTFRPTTLLKRDSNTGASLWVIQNV